MSRDVLRLLGPIRLNENTVLSGGYLIGGRLVPADAPTAPRAGDPVTAEISGHFLPGLVDMHCHLGLGANGAVPAEEAERQARQDRDAGTLLVRDAGSPSDTRWMQHRADVPRLVRAGRHIARPRRYLRHYAIEVEPADLARTMAAQARDGDGWVKIVADWIDREVGELRPLWPVEALRDGIAAAHAEGARVTAHTFSEAALDPLLDAGIDCLEHATGADRRLARRIADAAVPVVPTMMQRARFGEIADQATRYPRYAATMRAMHADRYRQLVLLQEAGVSLLAGTDAGGTIAHGTLPEELREWVRAGLTAMTTVAAATWRARAVLSDGRTPADDLADLVGYDADPTVDIGTLARPRHIILRGRLVVRD